MRLKLPSASHCAATFCALAGWAIAEQVRGSSLLLSFGCYSLTVFVVHRLAVRGERARSSAASTYLEQLGLMAAGMAHNFRNYLSILENTAAKIEQCMARPEDTVRARQIQLKCFAQARRTVDLLMSYVKHRGSHLHDDGKPVTQIIEDSVELAKFLLHHRNVSILWDTSRVDPTVKLHGAALSQSLLNLLKNAAEASQENSQVVISTRIDHGATGPSLCISVKDCGCGFDQDVLNHLFRDVVSGKESGTGVGLITVKQLVEEEGGTVEIESAPAQGTEITLRYPLEGRA